MQRGVMRVFVRPTVVPEDALSRLHGRARPLLYVLEERSTSDLLALEIASMDGGLRRPSKRLKVRDLDLPHSAVALERRAGVLRRRADRRMPPELARVVAAAGVDEALELDVVPVAVYWGRAPQREKSFFRPPVLGETGRSSARSGGCCRSCSTAAAR
jgi:glycerol-3-phosphate O-acyltransferase